MDNNEVGKIDELIALCNDCGGVLHIYTDGACSVNPGQGGWGIVFVVLDRIFTMSGYSPSTTNNKMEMLAVINALKVIRDFDIRTLHIYTDSTYVKNGITLWIERWLKNNWKTSGKGNVKNQELWIELHRLSSIFNIEWHWVKGHSDNVFNNKADLLARNAIKNCEKV